MPPQKVKQQNKAAALGKAKQQKKPVVEEQSFDEEEEDDNEDMDEDLDEIDEDVSLGSDDEAEDVENTSDDDEEEDEEEEEEVPQPAAKKAKFNGKEETSKDVPKKEAKLKSVAEASEEKSKVIGPLTDAERGIFAKNFRAMSATSIFVGKLPSDASEEDLKKLHPAIKTIRRPVSRKGAPATFGFLNFANKETADRALKEIKKKGIVKIRGQEVLISENGNGQCHPPSTVDRRKLRIYGCPKFVTKDTVKKNLPGCIDVILGQKDKGNSIEAIAVFKTSAETKKLLSSQPTVTLNECVCALFYLNISHNVKQQERKKDKKQALKQKLAKDKNASDNDEEEEDEKVAENMSSKPIKKKENVKPKAKPTVQTARGKKRSVEEIEDDLEEADPEEVEDVKPTRNTKTKKVSMKSPQKTPVQQVRNSKGANKTPVRKATPFKKARV